MALLDEAVIRAGLQGQKRWSVSLPSNTARTAILTMETEPSSSNEFNEIFDWKAENVFGIPAGEMRISSRKISPDANGKSRYFATAVKLSVIDEYETIFERRRWNAGLIMPRAVSEAKWLYDSTVNTDSLLISSQSDGFVALLLRGDEPAVVRSVTCTESERDDEIFRLLMFYRDRLEDDTNTNLLEHLLLIGKDFSPVKLEEIANEALGRSLHILQPEDIGLNLPIQNLNFDDLAAPAGLASYGWR